MTLPTISSEAVEAAAEAYFGTTATSQVLAWADLSSGAKYVYRERALAILIPASKHIAASALRDEAASLLEGHPGPSERITAKSLLAQAEKIEES